MMVMFHVFAALSSIILTSITYFSPSRMKLRGAYGLTALTLASGFYLVASKPEHMLQSCMMGVAYITLVTVGIIAVRRKLVAARVDLAEH